ncbi:hypothetical protein [Actinoplanes sp. URMC 104]|uniref:hypothetical protein n=1 Tax=Actinoplanes sp. URMC 104 TaxID=3423409 RepID=UPI003F19E16F
MDDALDKLARRDELRRRASGEAPGTPQAVTELVEAVAAVVARHPELGVSVGVEGAGDPLLLHFYLAEGQVQVNAESAAALAPDSGAPRHADAEVEIEEPPYSPAPASAEPVGGDTRRLNHDDQDRFGPATFGYPAAARPEDPPARYEEPTPRYEEPAARYEEPAPRPKDHFAPRPQEPYYGESDTAERRYGSFDSPAAAAGHDQRRPGHDPGESSRDLGARLRNLGMASSGQPPVYPPHPFAATPPPPVPPQTTSAPPQTTPMPPQPRPAVPSQEGPAGATRRIRPEQHRAPAEPSAAERGVPARPMPERGAPSARPVPEQRSMPTPLPEPIPLQVERPEETEMAARRLAALLRDDPSLLD